MPKLLKFMAVLMWIVSALSLRAELAMPEGRVLLTVSGAISESNSDGAAMFDREMMQSLDWQEIETYTSFTTGQQAFAGPTLSSLLEAVGASGSVLTATAVNDYAIEIPISHADAHDVILAMDMNGKPMRVRDKGPIWVVYPLSETDAEKKPFDNQMIWQLDRLSVQ